MNENIDLTKILKGCPEGFQLYSPIFGIVYLKRVTSYNVYITTIREVEVIIRKNGRYFTEYEDSECILFPSKDQRDWSKFTAPWYNKQIKQKFQVGQYITDGHDSGQIIEVNCYCYKTTDFTGDNITIIPFTLQDNYHLWTIQDAKDGDVIHFGIVTAIFKKYIGREKCICYCSFYKDGGFEIPIENGEDNVYGCYNATPTTKEQYDELMKAMHDVLYVWDTEKKELKKMCPNRFDPKTLKPFDKVLVRDECYERWRCEFYSYLHDDNGDYPYIVINDAYKHCIPYNDDTKHLLGTTDEAPEYYRYWED